MDVLSKKQYKDYQRVSRYSVFPYYYNSPLLFWIIADFNQIQDPYKELVIGTLLKIPTYNAIQFDIE